MVSKFKESCAGNAFLPHDIILNILERLPAKSLGRFRTASRSWLNSITDPNFIKSHLHRAIHGDCVSLFLVSEPRRVRNKPPDIRQTRIYSVQGNTFNKSVELEDPFAKAEFRDLFCFPRLLGTCNGLVCLGRPNEICLLNPCSREYKIVKFDKVFHCAGVSYGLGYDQVSDDYKLVAFMNRRNSSGSFDSVVSIYSLNDTSCSTVVNIPYCCCYQDDCGIYLNGYVHWTAIAGDDLYRIITVDVRENIIREIPLPVGVDKYAQVTLGVLRGKLCVLSVFYNTDVGMNTDVGIWSMENYGASDSWIKLLSVEATNISTDVPSKPLCFADSGKFLLRNGIKPVIYDPEQKIVRDVDFHCISWVYMCTIMTHVESLAPVNSSTYLGTINRVASSKKRKR